MVVLAIFLNQKQIDKICRVILNYYNFFHPTCGLQWSFSFKIDSSFFKSSALKLLKVETLRPQAVYIRL